MAKPKAFDPLVGKPLYHGHDYADVEGVTDALDTRYVNVTGNTMIGTNSTTFFQIQQADTTPVFNVDTTNGRVEVYSDPTELLQVATKQYVDNILIYNLDGGRADTTFGGVGMSPLDGGSASSF